MINETDEIIDYYLPADGDFSISELKKLIPIVTVQLSDHINNGESSKAKLNLDLLEKLFKLCGGAKPPRRNAMGGQNAPLSHEEAQLQINERRRQRDELMHELEEKLRRLEMHEQN